MPAAPYVLLDAKITVNGVDLSTWIQKVTLKFSGASQDANAFGSNGWGSTLSGLKSFALTLDLLQDFTASTGLDAVIWPLFGSNTAFTVQSLSSAVSTSNPKYSGTVAVQEYAPLDGSVGDVSKTSVTWNGVGAPARATT